MINPTPKVRHLKRCSIQDANVHTCRCPLYAFGQNPVTGKRLRIALDTSNWERAIEKIREMEAEPEKVLVREEKRNAVKFETFKTDLLADAAQRPLAEETIRKLRFLLDELAAYGRATGGLVNLDEFTPQVLMRYRQSWRNRKNPAQSLGVNTATKKLERLKTIFKFATENKYLEMNPAGGLKGATKAQQKKAGRKSQPFDATEWLRIVGALEAEIVRAKSNEWHISAIRTRALVMLMRYTGLRIQDAISVRGSQIKQGKLFYDRTQKAGTDVSIRLPEFVVKMLEECPHMAPGLFFKTAKEKGTTARGDWSKKLQRLFKAAEIADGHSHRFRHTFAATLLSKGTPVVEVASFLGHSARITEKYYSFWIQTRQEAADANVARALADDPTVLLYGSKLDALPRN